MQRLCHGRAELAGRQVAGMCPQCVVNGDKQKIGSGSSRAQEDTKILTVCVK